MRPRVLIMAHHARRRSAERLHAQIGGTIIWDPEPRGHPSAWRTARLCWQADPQGASHLLVVQEDAVPCEDFLARAEGFIALHPAAMVSFYVGSIHAVGRTYKRYQRAGAPSVPLPINHFVPTVALAMPWQTARAAVAYLDDKLPPRWRYDDEAFKLYRQATKVEAFASIPCLVSHDNQARSVMRHQGHGARYPISG